SPVEQTSGEQATVPPAVPPPAGVASEEMAPTWRLTTGAVPPSQSSDDVPRILGRYRIEKKLGEGGMGAVYLARDTQLDRQVALKIPHLQGGDSKLLAARFLREAQAAAALRHPNICPIYDLGEIDGQVYLTMAFISGESLARRIRSGPPL